MSQPEIRICQRCGGSGRVALDALEPDEWPIACQECGGIGQVWLYPKAKWAGIKEAGLSDIGWLMKEFVTYYLRAWLKRTYWWFYRR